MPANGKMTGMEATRPQAMELAAAVFHHDHSKTALRASNAMATSAVPPNTISMPTPRHVYWLSYRFSHVSTLTR
jgi:hypothetical protein